MLNHCPYLVHWVSWVSLLRSLAHRDVGAPRRSAFLKEPLVVIRSDDIACSNVACHSAAYGTGITDFAKLHRVTPDNQTQPGPPDGTSSTPSRPSDNIEEGRDYY